MNVRCGLKVKTWKLSEILAVLLVLCQGLFQLLLHFHCLISIDTAAVLMQSIKMIFFSPSKSTVLALPT